MALEFGKIIRSLFKFRAQINKPEDVHKQNIEQADTIIDFAASPQWPKYQQYIERKLARSLEGAFQALALPDGDAVLRSNVAEAKAYYEFLKDLDQALFVMKQEADRHKRPT